MEAFVGYPDCNQLDIWMALPRCGRCSKMLSDPFQQGLCLTYDQKTCLDVPGASELPCPFDRLPCCAAAVHNNGFLPVYDVLPFVVDTPVGPMVQAGIIPLVLAPIWVLYGYLQPLLDEVFANDVSLMHDCECCCTVLSARVRCLACSVT